MENNRNENDQKEAPKQDNSFDGPSGDRRKGIDRRWIKSGYTGPERRRLKNRRDKKPKKNGDFDPSRL